MTLPKTKSEHEWRQWADKERKRRNKRLMGEGFKAVDDREKDGADIRKEVNSAPDPDRIKAQKESIEGLCQWAEDSKNLEAERSERQKDGHGK